ncbi:GPI-GlcNAc transferase complex, PIG-H component-domain-containing protein [Bombardia bombarda]|uniref:GPI-GlcNAc transferase complex, PIG-H component-domain-containing protein n=1 Tax=Bombardia bombarda TaxID=252184 RepID=A0AA40BW49_9PEZI|nr:GPI-GlcNAc transferase complex, PIG-H component-domain-containing protein [Bombardia bombarda]
MLITSPHLYIRRPSPTTAEFTATTCPPLTLPLRLLLFLILLLRIALVATVLIALHSTWILSPTSTNTTPYGPAPSPPPSPLGQSQPPQHLPHHPHRPLTPWTLLLPSLFLLYLAALLGRIHTTESVLVLRGLGIQTSSSAAGGTRFIPTNKIQDVLINEAFRGFEVRYYLVVVVEGEDDVTVVFPALLPRRRIVEAVWRGVRECLYETGEGKLGNGC